MTCRRSHHHPSAVAVLTAALWLLPIVRAEAQQFKASVTGIVTDAQGAVVPGVTVAVLNTDTNVVAETVTNGQGVFVTQDLNPGPYRITATIPGFKTYIREGIVLRTAETVTLHIALTLGALEENVTVVGRTSEIETNQSVLSQTMDNKKVSELPLNGRQVYMLLQLTAGTLFTQQSFGATGFSGTRAWDVNGSVTIHGSRTGNNEFMIDGAPGSGQGGGSGAWNYAPPVDAVEEFKVDTASTNAAYGRTSGGVVNLTLRSGTNTLHGSATGLARGTALDANQIQNILNDISNKGHTYFDGEGMLSGPVRRDRTFFMGGYQGFYEEIPFPATSTVPTALQLGGDFSQTFNSAGQLIQIFDPLTTVCAGTTCTRQPFPGNVIPKDRINAVSAVLAGLMPKANAQGTISGQNNFVYSPNLGHYRYNSYLTRIDHLFSPTHRMSFSNTGNWGSERRDENSLPPPALRSDNWPTHRNHYLVTVDDSLTVGARTFVNTRVSYDAFYEPHNKEFGPLGDAKLPFRTPYQLTETPWFPTISIGGFSDMFARGFRESDQKAYAVKSTVSQTRGAHLVTAGAEFRLYKQFRLDQGNLNGTYAFSGGFTQRNPLQSDATSGSALASFLLGYPSSNGNTGSNVSINAGSDQRYANYIVYMQDDWKLSPRATVNLGLRYDYQQPVHEANNAMTVGYDRTTPNPLQLPAGTINPATGQPFGTLRGGLMYAGVNGAPATPYKGDFSNIQPRVGLTYKVTDRLAARANYGRSYLGISACCGGVQQDGFSQTTDMVVNGPAIGVPVTTLDSPFAGGGFLQPVGSALGLATRNGDNFSYRNPDFTLPYTDLWMAGVNVELPWNVGLDIAYVGNKVSGLTVGRNVNIIPIEEQLKGIARLGGNPTYLSTQLPNPFAGLVPGTTNNTATLARSRLLVPNPLFQGITQDFNNIGWATYRALEMSANKRLTHDLSALVTYTWSRRRTATTLLNGWDDRPFEDIDSNDRPHRVTIAALWGLPFGPGKAIGANTSGSVARLIEGWQFNVIGEITSGTPIGINSASVPLQDHFALPKDQQSIARWFDNSTRTNPRPDGTFAWDVQATNDFRVGPLFLPDVRQDSKPQWSMSVFKNTRMGHGRILQFRAELFNVFNVRMYGAPNVTAANANFGTISNSQINFARTGQLGLRMTF
jgi:outer membrane receptor protein involved in Fe transport